MYISHSSKGTLDQVDVRKPPGEPIDIWVRGPASLCLTVEEARWLMEALRQCLEEIPGIPADAPEKEPLFVVRSLSHFRGSGVERRKAAPPAPDDT